MTRGDVRRFALDKAREHGPELAAEARVGNRGRLATDLVLPF